MSTQKPTLIAYAVKERDKGKKAIWTRIGAAWPHDKGKGFSIEHYSAQDKPLFEVIEGEGEKQQVKPIFSIPEILSSIKEVGRRGLSIKRFKGLGEMNPKELFETTMNPVRRKLLRIDVTDAIEAEEMFTKLMGEEVEPRRQFIEDNALNVRNLDI